jgi:hypothetical protein
MANNNNDNNDNKLIAALKNVDTKMVTSAMLTPYNVQLDNTEQERAVNPMAIRPPNLAVTLTEKKPSVNIIKKLFGF